MGPRATFRSMFSLASTKEQRGEVVMVDKTIEHSLVIGAVLDIIHDLRVSASHIKDCHLLSYVIDFANKWEFTKVPQIISQGLISSMTDSNPNVEGILRLAVRVHDHEIVAKIIATYGADPWGRYSRSTSDTSPSRSIPRSGNVANVSLVPVAKPVFGDVADLGGMDWATYRELSPEITWAWANAYSSCFHADAKFLSDGDYKRMSGRYKTAIQELGKLPFITSS